MKIIFLLAFDKNASTRIRAPTARNIIARGKREARRPWGTDYQSSSPERAKYSGPSGLDTMCALGPGATRFALAPGCHIPRRWRYFFRPNPSSRMGRSMLHQPVIGFIFV